MEEKCCCASIEESGEKKLRRRTPEEYKRLCNRLSRIEGQIRGIRRMLDESAYCPDILTQAAIRDARPGLVREGRLSTPSPGSF